MGREERRRKERMDRQNALNLMPPNSRELYSKVVNKRITMTDIEVLEEKNYKRGFVDGGKTAAENTMKSCYAAAALAVKEIYGGDAGEITRFLQRLDDVIVVNFDSQEAIDRALEETGILLQFKNSFSGERIKERGAVVGSDI